MSSHSNSIDSNHSTIKSEYNTDLLKFPPALNYSLRDRKKSITITWTLIILDSCILPIILFYALWYTKMSHLTGKHR